MNYEFTKDCEIMNCEFLEGEIVDTKAVQFYPTVMKQTEEAVTHTVAKTGDTLVKTEVVKAKKAEKADPKEGEAKKEEKKNKKADPKDGEAKAE